MNIKIFFKKYWRFLTISLIAICFFIGSSSFNYITQRDDFIKWLSPDETANYIFVKFYGQEGRLQIFEKYNLYVRDIIHPRSFSSNGGWLKPASFLGIILIYGKIVSLTGYKTLPYLTPFIAAIGIIFYYLFLKKIFSRRVAFISSLLLAIFPVYIYYSARSMFHNILFIVLLIIGLYYGLLMDGKNKKDLVSLEEGGVGKKYWPGWLYAALAGLFLGLALTVRTSELLWLGPILFILWMFNLRNISISKLVIFISFLFLSFLPVFYCNQILYGSFWHGGYPEMNQSILNVKHASLDLAKAAIAGQLAGKANLFLELKNNIFYFGWHPYHSVEMFYFYFAKMFYWLFWPAVLGAVLFLRKMKKWKVKHWAYIILWLIASAFLFFYYGSWGINDNPDWASFTIGNSYTRYWLPIYLGALPFSSMFIIKLSNIFKKKIFVSASRITLLIIMFIISIKFLLYGSDEGLINSAIKLRNSGQEFSKVLNLTESNSVIITRYHDKLFFPERKVIVGLFDDNNLIKQYAELVNYLPVYYYNFTFPQKDLDYLNNKKLPEAGLGIEEVSRITSDFTLYKLERSKVSNTSEGVGHLNSK